MATKVLEHDANGLIRHVDAPFQAFACIYRASETPASQSIATGTTWTKVAPFDAAMAEFARANPDFANAKIILETAGVYHLSISRAFTVSATSPVDWSSAIGVSGVIQPQFTQGSQTASASQIYQNSQSGIFAAPAGAEIEMFVRHGAGASVTLGYRTAVLAINRIGNIP